MSNPLVGLIVTFSATGQSDSYVISRGDYNLSISGTFTGAITLERDPIGDGSWTGVVTAGAPGSYNGTEVELNIPYRLNCSALSSGTPKCRLKQP